MDGLADMDCRLRLENPGAKANSLTSPYNNIINLLSFPYS